MTAWARRSEANTRGVAGIALASALVLSACSEPAPQDPREVAIASCEQAAVAQYDLESAGQTEVRELPAEEGDAFEVLGASEGAEWVGLAP